jgi:polyisoprenoid-binding protein YceI
MRKGESFRRALLALALVAATIQAQARSSWKIDPSQTHVLFWVDAIGWPRTPLASLKHSMAASI